MLEALWTTYCTGSSALFTKSDSAPHWLTQEIVVHAITVFKLTHLPSRESSLNSLSQPCSVTALNTYWFTSLYCTFCYWETLIASDICYAVSTTLGKSLFYKLIFFLLYCMLLLNIVSQTFTYLTFFNTHFDPRLVFTFLRHLQNSHL